jgi:ABC-type glycerol-3-phosphate transport system permease component
MLTKFGGFFFLFPFILSFSSSLQRRESMPRRKRPTKKQWRRNNATTVIQMRSANERNPIIQIYWFPKFGSSTRIHY